MILMSDRLTDHGAAGARGIAPAVLRRPPLPDGDDPPGDQPPQLVPPIDPETAPPDHPPHLEPLLCPRHLHILRHEPTQTKSIMVVPYRTRAGRLGSNSQPGMRYCMAMASLRWVTSRLR